MFERREKKRKKKKKKKTAHHKRKYNSITWWQINRDGNFTVSKSMLLFSSGA
jgi:hypothetical protein